MAMANGRWQIAVVCHLPSAITGIRSVTHRHRFPHPFGRIVAVDA